MRGVCRSLLLGLAGLGCVAAGGRALPALTYAPNDSGTATTLDTTGAGSLDHPFFTPVGANGRACATCHSPRDGWSIDPAGARRLFEATGGDDPLFRASDGAVSPTADLGSVQARRRAYAPLLDRGLLRIGLPLPGGAEFVIDDIDDPHGFATAAELSLFRRPLPTTNLAFQTSILWDGRLTVPGRGVRGDLLAQASFAAVTHAGAEPPPEPLLRSIVDFEAGLFTAQAFDTLAGPLDAAHAGGGPHTLAAQPSRPAIGHGARAFTLFDAWADQPGEVGARRAAIARGQALFDGKRILVAGRATTCSGCHDTPNVGTSSQGLFFDVGASHEVRRGPGMPLYTLRCIAGPLAGRVFRTTDPGRALVTGRCADMNAFKVPALRGLVGRPPYFHNGAAATPEAVIEHYARQFGIRFTGGERADLAAFLRAL